MKRYLIKVPRPACRQYLPIENQTFLQFKQHSLPIALVGRRMAADFFHLYEILRIIKAAIESVVHDISKIAHPDFHF